MIKIRRAMLTALIAAAVALVAANSAEAGLLRGVTRNGPTFESKVRVIMASFSTSAEVLYIDSGCCADVPKCCYDPCISYNYRGCRKACCGCDPPVKAVLKVKDPSNCCYIDVPVCLPACVKGEPCVTSRCGLFGRGVVEYNWGCGFKIRMVITKCGDVRVTYFGA